MSYHRKENTEQKQINIRVNFWQSGIKLIMWRLRNDRKQQNFPCHIYTQAFPCQIVLSKWTMALFEGVNFSSDFLKKQNTFGFCGETTLCPEY